MSARFAQIFLQIWSGLLALKLFFGSLFAAGIGERIIPYGSRMWQTGDDSPRNTVQAIAQTAEGFLWIGTQGGLARFDGERFEFFPVDPATDAKNQRINALCADGDSLWVGTTQGLFQLRKSVWTAHAMPPGVDKFILALHRANDESIGVGTRLGLALSQKENLSLVGDKNASASPLQRNAIRAISQHANGAGVWISAADNLILLKDGQAMTNLPFGAFKPDFIRAISHRRDGSIWVGSNSGLIRFHEGQYTHFIKTDGLPDNTVTALHEDRHGNLWVGTFGGLCRFVDGKFIVETTSEGEPYDQIFCFFEDHEGSLWMGAKDGLHQFNALQFTSYTVRHGLAHNNVISVYEDHEGVLWMGTWGGGLHSFHDGQIKVYSTANTKILRNDLILAIHGSRDGGIWFGTDYDGGLYFLKNGEFMRHGEEHGLSRNAIRALLEDRNGRLYVGRATDGVAFGKNGRFEQGGNSALHLDVFIRGTNAALYRKSYQQNVWSDWENLGGALASDPTAICWNSNRVDVFYRGTNDALWHQWWDGQWHGPEDLGGDLAGAPDVCSWGVGHLDVYIRGKDNALWHKWYFNDSWSEWTLVGGGLTSDPSTVSWGTNRVDVFYRGTNNAMWHRWLEHGRWNGPKDLGGVLVGAPDACSGGVGHLDVYHRGTDNACWHIEFQNGKWQPRYYSAEGVLLSDPEVVSAGTNRIDIFALGTNGLRHRPFDGQWHLPWKNLGGNPVGSPGVASYHPITAQPAYDWPDVKATRCLLQSQDGKIWIGTERGLSCWDNGTFSVFTTQSGLAGNAVFSLYEDREKTLWIGTTQGLSRSQTSTQPSQYRKFTTYDFWSETILEILEDDFQNLWLATKRGVIRVAKNELKKNLNDPKRKVSFALFGKADGMASQVCVGVAKPSAFKSKDGRLWFATTKGLAVTDPRLQIDRNEKVPPVVIRGILANKKNLAAVESEDERTGKRENEKSFVPVLSSSRFLIPPGRGELEFHYTALSYTAPEKNRFKYQLEGVDSDWIDADTRRSAFYNNVLPGDYTFRVIACNNDGVWNSIGSNVKIRLLPHFWQTNWFAGLIVLASIGLIAATARYITWKRLRGKLLHLEQQHTIEKERARIAQDMHDDLGVRLTELLLVGERATSDKAGLDETKSLVRRTSASIREVVDSLDAIVWAVNPQNDSLHRFIPYVREYIQAFLETTDIRFALDIPSDLPDVPLSSETRHHLFMVIRETLNNTVKHARATRVLFQLRVEDSQLFIGIEDDGKGFSANAASLLGNGLINMRKRIESIRGCLELRSEQGKGTRVELKVPLQR